MCGVLILSASTITTWKISAEFPWLNRWGKLSAERLNHFSRLQSYHWNQYLNLDRLVPRSAFCVAQPSQKRGGGWGGSLSLIVYSSLISLNSSTEHRGQLVYKTWIIHVSLLRFELSFYIYMIRLVSKKARDHTCSGAMESSKRKEPLPKCNEVSRAVKWPHTQCGPLLWFQLVEGIFNMTLVQNERLSTCPEDVNWHVVGGVRLGALKDAEGSP